METDKIILPHPKNTTNYYIKSYDCLLTLLHILFFLAGSQEELPIWFARLLIFNR
jgi:hypothetical protein